jgi:hypothetical protein
MERRLWWVAFSFLCVTDTFAQTATTGGVDTQLCRTGESAIECARRLNNAEELVGAQSLSNSGVTSLATTSGGAATNRDFASRLIAAIEAAEHDQPVTFDYNARRTRRPLKFELTLRHPDVASNVVSQLGSNAAAIEALKRDLSYSDDVTLVASYSTRNDAAFAETLMAKMNLAQTMNNEQVAEVQSAQAVRNTLRSERSVVDALNSANKFYLSALCRVRHNTAGPDLATLRGTYEWGSSGQQTASGAQRDRQTRVAAAAELTFTKANNVILPKYDLALHAPHEHVYAVNASWGATIYHGADVDRNGRLEFGARFEDVTGDPSKRNRIVGVLTYTQKVNSTTSLPIAVTYANHPNDVTDVDRRLGVHFGLSYKLQPK